MTFNNFLARCIPLEDAHPIDMTDATESVCAASHRKRQLHTISACTDSAAKALFALFIVHCSEVQI